MQVEPLVVDKQVPEEPPEELLAELVRVATVVATQAPAGELGQPVSAVVPPELVEQARQVHQDSNDPTDQGQAVALVALVWPNPPLRHSLASTRQEC